jgi:hypothetical protein
MASSTGPDEESVLVDTGVMRIEELRGPDQLPNKQRKLQQYLQESSGDDVGQRSLQPVTGDQGAFQQY